MSSRLVVLVGFIAACGKEPAAAPTPLSPPPQAMPTGKPMPKQPPRPAELAHVTIKALGMYCEESCPMRVRYALADNQVVYELGFDLTTESIFVSYDKALGPAKQVTKPMITAIKAAGFDPWLAKEDWPADAQVQVVLR